MINGKEEALEIFKAAYFEFLKQLNAAGEMKSDPVVWFAKLEDGTVFFQLTANFKPIEACSDMKTGDET